MCIRDSPNPGMWMYGDADTGDPLHSFGLAVRRLERNERTHGMADDARARDALRVQHAEQPVGHRADAGKRRSLGAAVAGQIERKHVAAVVGEVAALQPEERMVEPRPVHEHERRLPWI